MKIFPHLFTVWLPVFITLGVSFFVTVGMALTEKNPNPTTKIVECSKIVDTGKVVEGSDFKIFECIRNP